MTKPDPQPLTRREMICAACAVVLTGCGPRAGIPNDSGPFGVDTDQRDTADSTPTDTDGEPGYPCGEVAGDTADGWLRVSLALYPELTELYGYAVITVGGRTLNFAKVFEGCWVAMERACTHEGVAVNYKPERNQFVCPRHGALYDWDGSKVAGPQPSGLQVYPVAERDGDLWIKLT